MKSLLAAAVALAGIVCGTSPAQALGHRHRDCDDCCANSCCAPACTPMCVTYVDKQVTCYRPEYHTREVKCTVNCVVPREVIVPTQVTC